MVEMSENKSPPKQSQPFSRLFKTVTVFAGDLCPFKPLCFLWHVSMHLLVFKTEKSNYFLLTPSLLDQVDPQKRKLRYCNEWQLVDRWLYGHLVTCVLSSADVVCRLSKQPSSIAVPGV